MAFPDTMIRPHPRYHELYLLRSSWNSRRRSRRSAASARATSATSRSGRTWRGSTRSLFEKDPELAEFKAKGRHYTEEEKQWLLDKQRALLARVIPLHRKLAERGQVELTTTPYYHPILPLLLDKRLAREAMPDVDAAGLPRRVSRGRRACTSAAPSRATPSSSASGPRACGPARARSARRSSRSWPSTESSWIATDEEILGCSTHGLVGRDSRGHVRNPELLYRPWKVREAGHELAIIFRDHSMSDQVGFHYQRSPGPVAAGDFLGKVHAIGDACRHNPATLVPVILDGENCWEYYPDGGVSFLRSLYQGAARDPRIRPVRSDEFLARAPAASRHRSPGSSPGSWISHNFAIWIGHPEDNRAWDALHAAREFLVSRGTLRPPRRRGTWRGPGTRSTSPRAPTGSGGSATTIRAPSTALFDHLFRKHLRNVYTLLGCDPPGSLFTPISRGAPHRPLHDQPVSFLRVKVDGRATVLRMDRRRPLRLRQRPRDHDAGRQRRASNRSGSASMPSGC